MSFTRLTLAGAKVLERPGKRSVQLVSTQNAAQARCTVTRVVIEPGATSPLHAHPAAQQIWIVEEGEAQLLTRDGEAGLLCKGDVLVIEPGESHGLHNTQAAAFVYLTVTTPPEDMAHFYGSSGDGGGKGEGG